MKFIGAGARPGQPLVHRDAVFTVPNVLTVVRFLGVPLFIWLVLAEQQVRLRCPRARHYGRHRLGGRLHRPPLQPDVQPRPGHGPHCRQARR